MPEQLINYRQIWLARVAEGHLDSPRIRVIQITGCKDGSAIKFRDLESETPFGQLNARDMAVFELISLVKN